MVFLKQNLVKNLIMTGMIVFVVSATIFLPEYAKKTYFLSKFSNTNIFTLGNYKSWFFVASIFLWAYLWLDCTTFKHFGPKTDSGYIPEYKSRGVLYHYATILVLLISFYLKPELPIEIYENMGDIMCTLNVFGLLICSWLMLTSPEANSSEQPFMIRFFLGSQRHPYFLGVNIKQLVIPRIGVMMWQIFNIIFLFAGLQKRGNTPDYGHIVNVLLQAIYILKSTHLEHVLVTMVDFTHDRAGFYLIWGSLAWIPAVNGFQSYLLVEHKSNMSITGALLTFCFGTLAIWFNYDVLRQKQRFREGIKSNKMVSIWGQRAKGIQVEYEDIDNDTGEICKREAHLLISGWWGIGRKMNYFWESIATLIWSLPGNSFGWTNYIYFVSLFLLFVVRSAREDYKCRKKYGKGWDEYCSIVPYRFLPYLF